MILFSHLWIKEWYESNVDFTQNFSLCGKVLGGRWTVPSVEEKSGRWEGSSRLPSVTDQPPEWWHLVLLDLAISSHFFFFWRQYGASVRKAPLGSAEVLFFLIVIFYLFLYLFLAVLGLCFCARAFSSCGKRLRQAGATLHCGARASHYRGLSLRSTGSRRAGSVVVAHGPSCSAACGIFPDQGSNPCPLH